MRRAAPYSAALIALLLLPVGCKPPESGKKPDASPSPAAIESTPVRVAEARVAPLQKSLAVTGSVAATQSVELAPKIAARVVFLAGREGESVRAGQVVLRQDVSDLQTQVASSEAAVRQSEAQVGSAIANVRAADARLAQARTQAKLQTTTSDSGVRDAEQQLASARASLEVAKKPQRTQEVRVAENVVASAQASFEKAASDKKRYEELLKEGAVAQITYEQYVTQEKLARAQLDTAKQQLTLTREGGRV